MASAPVYAVTPKTGLAVSSTANLNRDGSGSITPLFVPGTNGSRVTSATVVATVSTGSVQLVRFYRSTDAGSSWKLWREVVLGSIGIATGTPGATFTTSFIDPAGNAVTIASGDRIGVSAELAASINVITEYADL